MVLHYSWLLVKFTWGVEESRKTAVLCSEGLCGTISSALRPLAHLVCVREQPGCWTIASHRVSFWARCMNSFAVQSARSYGALGHWIWRRHESNTGSVCRYGFQFVPVWLPFKSSFDFQPAPLTYDDIRPNSKRKSNTELPQLCNV